MRLLFDENLDHRLKRFFGEGNEIRTVREQGWLGKKNGELIRLAEREFDALATMDRSMPHQQNLSEIDLAIALLEAPSNRIADLAPLVEEIEAALPKARPGEVVRVKSP